MPEPEFKYADITGKIIGAAMTVHTALGNGFQEVIYQRALALELTNVGLAFSRELEMPVHYNGVEVGTRRADFLVEGKILAELKAVSKIEDAHIAQTINYLEAYKLEIALLLNFGSTQLQYRRFTNQHKLEATTSVNKRPR